MWGQFNVRHSLVLACTFLKIYSSPSNAQSQFNCRILICCICHFWGGSLFFFHLGWPHLFASLSSVSDLCPDMREPKWHLLGIACSVVLWTGRNTASKPHWRVGSVCRGWTTQGLPRPLWHAPSRSKPLRLPGAQRATVPGGLCVSSRELGSGCDTPGRYEQSRISGRHG